MFIDEPGHQFNFITRANIVKLIILCLCVGLVVMLCAKSLTPSSSATFSAIIHENGRLIIPEQSPLRKVVTVEEVKKQCVIRPFIAPATVQVDPSRFLNVLPPVLGQITRIDKILGEKVSVGDVLFSIRSPDFSQALSDVEKANAVLIFTKQTYERQKQLIASKISSMHDTQQAKSDYEQAESEYLRAKARLKELHANVASNHGQSVLTLKSPISGYVTDVKAAVGGYWSDATAPVMVIADLSHVYLNASLQEKDIGVAYMGQSIKFTFPTHKKIIQSKIDYISPVLSPDTRTIDVGVLYDNRDGLLRPNTFAKAVLMGRPKNRVLLPLTAVIQRGFDSIVFVEVSPWVFEPRVVQVGPQVKDNIEIISGLTAGERVASTGGIILND